MAATIRVFTKAELTQVGSEHVEDPTFTTDYMNWTLDDLASQGWELHTVCFDEDGTANEFVFTKDEVPAYEPMVANPR